MRLAADTALHALRLLKHAQENVRCHHDNLERLFDKLICH